MVEVLKAYGIVGFFLVIIVVLIRMVWQQNENYRKDTERIFSDIRLYQEEWRKMYENNVTLVENYETVATDLRTVVIISTQTLQKVCDAIHTNQYCPQVRLEKNARGMQS